ncbi:MAG: ImmA/IrrE family metallo-endopeptidase [Paludibacteraceae bacterium]|nr:ImmA/IrrE family metallo-endopeptidase [Paludibacteraceae bacterium]
MNTTDKGSKYEQVVYDLLKNRVEERIDGKYVKLNLHKKYISKICPTRELDMDVSIDCYLTQEDMDNDEPYTSLIFECKNYKSKPDIGRFDEFAAKMKHLPGTKGYFVTTVGFSEQTINAAKAEGIGLIQVKECSSGVNYIVKRTINDYNGYRNNLESLKTGVNEYSSLAYEGGEFDSLEGILIANDIPLKKGFCFKVPFIDQQTIEERTEGIIKSFPRSKDVISDIIRHENLMIHQIEMPDNMLAYLDLSDCSIFLNDRIKATEPRIRFTLAHELGHYYLHANILRDTVSRIGETENSITDTMKNTDDVKYLEYQANWFARSLLMPRNSFIKEVFCLFERYSINRGRLYVDYQEVNQCNYRKVTSILVDKFNVSVSAIRIRMLELGLLQEGDMVNPVFKISKERDFYKCNY